MKRRTALLLLAAWATLLLATHRGPRSPYTYAPQLRTQVTRNAAPDAVTVRPVTRFFYDGTQPDFRTAHNLRLPLHSFLTATTTSFVRAYPLANDLTNLAVLLAVLAAALRLAERHAIDMRAAALALATVCALPPVVGYIGQPMHYLAGMGISFLVLLTALALDADQLLRPWIAGLLTAILLLNYDPYIYAAALAAYVVFVVRLRSIRDALLYAVFAAAPAVLWHLLLRSMAGGELSNAVHNYFLAAILSGWFDYMAKPGATPLLPLAVTQIGLHVAVHQVIAIIYWPLVTVCGLALWKARGESFGRGRILLLLLAGLFLLEQLLCAAFDWENNPRRALPVFFAFACAYCWTVHRHFGRRLWTIAFVTLFVLTSFVSFADVLLGTAAAPALYMGDAMRASTNRLLDWQSGRVVLAGRLDPEYAALAAPFPRARLGGGVLQFAFANVFLAGIIAALLWAAARAALLPRFAPHVFGAIWLLSAIRFVV